MWIRSGSKLFNLKRYDTVEIAWRHVARETLCSVFLGRREGEEREYILDNAKHTEAEDLLREIQCGLLDGLKVFSVDLWLSKRPKPNQ